MQEGSKWSHSCAADSLRWKWPMVHDLIHSLALHLSNASRSSSQELRQSRTREEDIHVCLHFSTSSFRFWHALLPEDEPIAMCPLRGEEEARYMWQIKRAVYGTRRAPLLFREQMEFSKKEDTQHSRYVTKSVIALRRTRWLQSTATTSSLKESPRNWAEKLDCLDEVLKRLVVVKVLDRIGPRAAEHGQYLKRHIVYINGQGFKWLEDPKHLAAIIINCSKVGAKPQSSPGSKDCGRNDPEALDELEEVEGKLYQQDTGISLYVFSGRFDIQFCVKRLSDMVKKTTKAGQCSTCKAGKIPCGYREACAQVRSSRVRDTVRIAVDSDWAGSEERYSTHAGLEFHGEHLVDSWVASDQVRALSSMESWMAQHEKSS